MFPLFFDGRCPVCRLVASRARIHQRKANLELVDARSGSLGDIQGRDLRDLDFDEGFAVVVDGGVYHEAEAARVLAVLTKPRGVFYRLFRFMMRTESRSASLYPVLKSARRRLLLLMRVPPINQPEHHASQVLSSESN